MHAYHHHQTQAWLSRQRLNVVSALRYPPLIQRARGSALMRLVCGCTFGRQRKGWSGGGMFFERKSRHR
ncbi:uncharacterized protein LACBIDRAFT_300296 [Laccaria bicolor S238N-H82]|uniref:Predicted protein n=1 Tax=Laccaria bicolor (strain S238N-H82 / ATCC MYA-4686) TaxID=486041 RepID=B0DGF3_LACBS|nr:uncharacterized protein LACBIDRAFT_300296 [Laccaria bicolor S238N-H82]EDR06142.1 predicted protein [Laccaria bicolor S238N-H82]|eukprot:XP_001883003.1 predicted protein [Laccaria bicolor S238N-H82]